jgi:hypothetical protein
MKILFDKLNNRVVTEDDTKNVFYTDDFDKESDAYCDDEVIETVVKMFNDDKDIMEIDAYLLDEGKCSQEAREEIIEGIHNLLFGK